MASDSLRCLQPDVPHTNNHTKLEFSRPHQNHNPTSSIKHQAAIKPRTKIPTATYLHKAHSRLLSKTLKLRHLRKIHHLTRTLMLSSKRGGRGGGGGGHGRGLPREVQVSKKVSWLLRHGAEKEGLKLGEGGYVNVADAVRSVFLSSSPAWIDLY